MSLATRRSGHRESRVRRPLRRTALAGAALAAAISQTAVAAPAGGVGADNPGGATITVTTPSIPFGGTVSFTGTGFATDGKGEILNVKIDDGNIAPATPKYPNPQVWAAIPAAADGSVSGSVDLSAPHPNSPLSPGDHWIRILTGSGQPGDTIRTLHANFTVLAPTTPITPGTPPGPTTPGGPTPPTATTPIVTPTGPVWLADTAVKRTKTKKKIALKLKAGSAGSAGAVSVKTKSAYKLGKGKKKVRTLVKSSPYFVEQLGATTANLTLTAEGKKLIASKKELKAIVTLRDAGGEDTVKTEVTITR